jgi:hypothetical protein
LIGRLLAAENSPEVYAHAVIGVGEALNRAEFRGGLVAGFYAAIGMASS